MAESKPKSGEPSGRFAYEGLERVFHEKARLGIMTSLISQPRGVVFADLKELCHLTDGNLSRHLQVLNEAGLVEIWKGYHKNRPQTLCRAHRRGPAPVLGIHQRAGNRRPRRGERRPHRPEQFARQSGGRLVPRLKIHREILLQRTGLVAHQPLHGQVLVSFKRVVQSSPKVDRPRGAMKEAVCG